MQYSPTVLSNQWVTATTSANGNGGIHDQRQFKAAVLMVESAIINYANPKLMHLVLTQGSISTYTTFIARLKRCLAAKDIEFEYKGCNELDSLKGVHQHFMFVVNADNNPFDQDDPQSPISRVTESISKTEPSFTVKVCQPKRYDTPYVPLSRWTLQDSCDWLSYAFKSRSKPEGQVYLSSRVKGVSIGSEAFR